MDNDVFPNKNRLPNLLKEILNETGVDSLSPGESTWTVPWALRVTEDGSISIRSSMAEKDQRPGGTIALKVVMDFDGIFIDASALGQEEVEKYFKPTSDQGIIIVGGSEAASTPVIGVIYPAIRDTAGLDPGIAEAFNQEQTEARSRLTAYFKKIYNMDYIFADEEIHGPRRG